jgi:L-alanine-DL-glutamate epimerase-like enolase superfamily enzyme
MAKIDSIDAFFFRYPFPGHINYVYSGGLVENMDLALIKVTDENGNYGIGEVTHGQFCYEPVIGMVKHFNDILSGHECFNINRAWEMMFQSSVFWNRQGLGIGVMGGIDIALHDLVAKEMGVPVYQLLGGLNKNNVRIYASNGLFDKHEPLIDDALKAYEQGFRAYKLRVTDPKSIIDLVDKLYEKMNGKIDIIVDAVQGSCANPWSVNISKKLCKKLEKYNILWFEEPVRVENIDGYVEVKNYSNVNIAGAESLPTADSFRQYLEKNTFDIIQFDIATSGFTEGKKIASVSSFYQKPLAIHSWGTIISILSGIHMALAASNCVYTEFGFMDHPFNGYLSNEEYQVHDGFFNAKQLGSGLGVRFDDQMEKLFPYNPSKINSMISFEETFNAL